jgi:RNA recognition motif-containing protein
VGTKLYIGKLPYSVDDAQLAELFGQAGNVVSATVIRERHSDRSKGFGFVEYATGEEAENAKNMFNGYDWNGLKLVVDEARPMEKRDNGATE